MKFHRNGTNRSPRFLGHAVVSASFSCGALAATLLCAGSPAVAIQDEIRIRNLSSAQADVSSDSVSSFLVRTARVPVFVDIDLGGTGAPRIAETAPAEVAAALDMNPRRLVILRFKGGALRFEDLSRATRERLLEKRGKDVVDAYNRYLAEQVGSLLTSVDALREGHRPT